MKPEDQAAFEEAWASLPGVDNGYEKSLAQLGWQLALAHRDAQPASAQGEPVAFCVEFDQAQLGRPTMDRREAEEDAALIPSKRRVVNLFREPPAAAINEQLLEAAKAIELAMDWQLGRSIFTQNKQGMGFQFSEDLRAECFAAHDAIRAAIEAAEQALAHVNETPKNEHDSDDVLKRAKLVRLTEMELWRNDELMALNAEFGLLFPDVQRFANAIQNAIEEKNK